MTLALFSDLDVAHAPTDDSFPVSSIHPGTTVVTFTASSAYTINSVDPPSAWGCGGHAQFSLLFSGTLPKVITNASTFAIAITYTPSGSGVPEDVHFGMSTSLGPMDVYIQGLPT